MHSVFAFVSEVEDGRQRELADLLASIRKDPRENSLLQLHRFSMLHFASLVVFPNEPSAASGECRSAEARVAPRGPLFVFESSVDGSIKGYVDSLISAAGPGLFEIYKMTKDGPRSYSAGTLRRYLLRKVVRPRAYHIGNHWRTVRRIAAEAGLYDQIESYADSVATDPGLTAPGARVGIQDFVRKTNELAFALEPATAPSAFQQLRPRLPSILVISAIVLVIIGLLTLPWYLGAVPTALAVSAFLATLRMREKTDWQWKGQVPALHLQLLRNHEDSQRVVQNHMATLTGVKPGLLRRCTLHAVLFLLNLQQRWSTEGLLSGIPTIHFAQWSIVDRGRSLLFLSNFDGSWESYLDDFIDKAGKGVVGVWGNTVGFPPTRWIFNLASPQVSRVKEMARLKQVPAAVWYSAYPNWTVAAINNNSGLRADLFTDLDPAATRNWLRRL